MKQRCYDKKNSNYRLYGGRGVIVCERWLVFENFYTDMGNRPSGEHSLDRIDNDGDYSKDNCKWSSRYEQSRNKRNNVKYNGECAIDASRRLGGNDWLVAIRISRGWSKKKAFTTLKITYNKIN